MPIIQERDEWPLREGYKRFIDALTPIKELKIPKLSTDFSNSLVQLGKEGEVDEIMQNKILEAAKGLIPWRKGPFQILGQEIDAEWRSDFKWDRLKKHLISLKGKKVLDIGCNNGYFLFRMLEQKPAYLLGIDPYPPYYFQFQFLQSLAQEPNAFFELFGVEHLHYFHELFDVIFSMGIIYHQRHPLEQLITIRNALKPGGQMILETIGIPGENSVALFPEDRYAQMRNVYFVPTLSCLINWVKKAKFIEIEVISDTLLTNEEQRNTPWCPTPYKSLDEFLDPNDKTRTVEGHPAPRRFCISARKRDVNQKHTEPETARIITE